MERRGWMLFLSRLNVDCGEPGPTAASYAPKVGNCKLQITKKRFTKVLIV
jgi:hypothetical protein